MSYTIFINILAFLLVIEQGDSFYPLVKARKSIQSEFKGKEVLVENIAWFDPASSHLNEKKGNLIGYKLTVDGTPSGYAFFSRAKGRFDFFEYMVLVSEQGAIQKVKVLLYLSEHGGEIRSAKWLEQFSGYSSGPLVYGKDIQAMTGATVSAGSITNDIVNLMVLFRDYTNKIK